MLDAPISIGNWSPQNYGRSYKGRLTLRDALRQSLNTVAVRLSIATGRQPIADLAAKMGVMTPDPRHPLAGARVVGADRARPGDRILRLCQWRISHRAARADRRAHARRGKVVYDALANPQPRQRVLKESTVLGMVDMMNTVVEHGTGMRARLPGINVSGKTGTTNAYRDAWFVGYTGNFTTAVWLGNDNYHADQPADRRLAAGDDLGEIHARRDGRRGADPASRPAAAGAEQRAARGGFERRRRP